MTTATATKTKTMPPPRPRAAPWQRRVRAWAQEKVWRARFAAYERGEAVRMPEAALMTSDEMCFALRIDILARGDRAKGLASLARLADRKLVRCVSYSGPGGGSALYPASEVARLLERLGGGK